MIVCHCRKVSDRVIRAAVQEGATTEEHVAEMCGAGSSCGGCLPVVCELIEEERRSSRCSSSHVRLPVLQSSPEC